MRTRILTVDDTFLIQGRGLVILGRKVDGFVDFNTGDSIEIENPDGTIVNTKVKGIEFVCRRNFDETSNDFDEKLKLISFLVENEVKKSHIAKNAFVWLLN
ncbi:MAG TPA: hypothetical protein VF692_07800 [Pyrinomonadaceae bacterium]|jgi:translation elongation factor EF-Tu-like GTPase